MGTFYHQRSAMMIQPNLRSFAKKNDDDPKNPDLDKFEEQKKLKKLGTNQLSDKSKKAKNDEKDVVEAESATETPVKKKRRTKAEIEADKIEKQVAKLSAKATKAKKTTKKKDDEASPPGGNEHMYTLKFNSPILPYAKFPLT